MRNLLDILSNMTVVYGWGLSVYLLIRYFLEHKIESIAGDIKGYELLNPYMAQWQTLRSYGYIFIVALLIAIAAYTVFRFVSATSPERIAIKPKYDMVGAVILGAVLITFSYSIAGFIMDLLRILFLIGN